MRDRRDTNRILSFSAIYRRVIFTPTIIFFIMFVSTLIFSSITLEPTINESDAKGSEVLVFMPPGISISVPNVSNIGELGFDTFAYTDTPVTVSTNNPTGYLLLMNMVTDETCLRYISMQDDPCSSIPANRKIPPTFPSVPVASFVTNTWGSSLTPFTTYNPIPPKSGSPMTAKNTSAAVENEITTVRFGAKGGMSISIGAYTNTVEFTALINPRPSPSITSMAPLSGTPGTVITFTGTNLDLIYQIYLSGTICANLTPISTTSATCEVADDGEPAGTRTVTGISIWGDSFIAPNFMYSPAEEFRFTIDTRMTDTIDTDPSHFDGVATTFAIPVSGSVQNSIGIAYNWVVNCGGSQPDKIVSGTGSSVHVGIPCTYTIPGEYQITVKPNGAAASGWMNAFGFANNTSGANAQANKNVVKSLDTPITDLSRTSSVQSRFATMFYGTRNLIGIPANLFSPISTSASTTAESMFANTFAFAAYNSTTATIPAGLFDTINTSNATSFANMFTGTFNSYAYNSTTATIPTGLLGNLNFTSSASGTSTFSSMFANTFNSFAYMNTSPSTDLGNLWGTTTFYNKLNATSVGGASGVFYRTFYNMRSLTGDAIPFVTNTVFIANPSAATGAFTGTQVTDYASLNANWQ